MFYIMLMQSALYVQHVSSIPSWEEFPREVTITTLHPTFPWQFTLLHLNLSL